MRILKMKKPPRTEQDLLLLSQNQLKRINDLKFSVVIDFLEGKPYEETININSLLTYFVNADIHPDTWHLKISTTCDKDDFVFFADYLNAYGFVALQQKAGDKYIMEIDDKSLIIQQERHRRNMQQQLPATAKQVYALLFTHRNNKILTVKQHDLIRTIFVAMLTDRKIETTVDHKNNYLLTVDHGLARIFDKKNQVMSTLVYDESAYEEVMNYVMKIDEEDLKNIIVV